MCRAICAIYVERSEDRLYYRKHNGIAQCYFEHVSQRYEEAKSGVVFFSGVQYIISVRDIEDNMLGSVHASTTYGM
jgi:hypothetical protein